MMGCSSPLVTSTAPSQIQATISPTLTEQAPTLAPRPASPTLAPSPTPPPSVWISPDLPAAFLDAYQLADGVIQSHTQDEADYLLAPGIQYPVSQWVYALVAPFPTIPDGVRHDEVMSAWSGSNSGLFAGVSLLMDSSTRAVLVSIWGEPAAGAVQVLQKNQLVTYAWENRPSWAILPFEDLEPRWKVLAIDGNSPFQKDFDPASYSLTVPFSLAMENGSGGVINTAGLFAGLPPTNRDPKKFTTLAMTGVTALVRATAETMRRYGNIYPAQDILDILRGADLLHVSNEIPFKRDCPHPNTRQEDLVFCSRPEYFELLEHIGTDVVELTGDHFGDHGPDAMRFTLDLYSQAGLPYYGGGYTEEDARQALLMEHNGNKLAFLGCNAKGGGYATARGDNPGAVECDFDWLAAEIPRLKAQGYLPIVTFQHFEYYSYIPQPKLIHDFQFVAEAGALIVSGSQAHQPHGMQFHAGAFLHYGLGNLFFDQFFMGIPTSQGMIDWHVFYDRRYLGVDLIGIYFVDYARSRPMTSDEREALLQSIFEASLWD